MKIKNRQTDELFDSANIISNPNMLGKKIKQVKNRPYTDDGLFSTTIFGDIDNCDDEYKCQCGHLVGKIYNGTTCPKCKTKVVFVEKNINKNGWIDISGNQYDEDGNIIKKGKGYKIIRFINYLQVEKIIGPKTLKKIISTKNQITLYGDLDYEAIETERAEDPENKYWYCGLKGFYENYNEILDYYYDLHEGDEHVYETIQNRDEIFTDKICVISPLLRPAVRTKDGTKDGLRLDQINKYYQNILKANALLNNNVIDIELHDMIQIHIIQAEYFNLCQYVIGLLSGKQGLIRNNIVGARINFCARNIVTPAKVGRKINEIVLPYITFAEMYKFQLINLIKKMKGCTMREATKIWFNATLHFDNDLYLLMQSCIKNNNVRVLLNRNPSISYGSIVCLRVCDIKKDYNDVTASISNVILVPLAADYDGDVLNIVAIHDKEMADLFEETFSPMKMLISSNNSKFNDGFGLSHDLVLGGEVLLNED